jgi:hypothetical protein
MEPGVEPIGIANRPDVEPCGRERVLNRVVCPIVVAKDQPRSPVEA